MNEQNGYPLQPLLLVNYATLKSEYSCEVANIIASYLSG